MENVTNIINDKKFSTNKIMLDNRKKLVLNGVEKVLSSNDDSISLVVSGTKLYLGGHNLHIEKLDVESGLIEAEGDFESIKFGGTNKSFLKRLFK